jgi:hypothetical protein
MAAESKASEPALYYTGRFFTAGRHSARLSYDHELNGGVRSCGGLSVINQSSHLISSNLSISSLWYVEGDSLTGILK